MLEMLPAPVDADDQLIARLRSGDEAAFVSVVDRYGSLMLHIAMGHVRTRSVAEEVVQETWLAVLAGLDRFEARSSLKTWILRILVNRAKTRGAREARCVPFSSLAGNGAPEPAVDASRFLAADHDRWPGHWAVAPRSWAAIPDDRLLARETLGVIARAIDGLPDRQREVIVLRDVEGCDASDVCAALGVSEGNQRVLLHRARSKVRAELERYLDGEVSTA
jgi:RNA polymerase sigma-70 factor (ECF subfamily)